MSPVLQNRAAQSNKAAYHYRSCLTEMHTKCTPVESQIPHFQAWTRPAWASSNVFDSVWELECSEFSVNWSFNSFWFCGFKEVLCLFLNLSVCEFCTDILTWFFKSHLVFLCAATWNRRRSYIFWDEQPKGKLKMQYLISENMELTGL